MSLQALGARSGGEFATLEKIIIPRRPKEKRVDSHLLSGACLYLVELVLQQVQY